MMQQQQQQLSSHSQQQPHHRPLYQFPVTKLRSWRTGYVRILAFYENHFVTYDPTSTTAAPNSSSSSTNVKDSSTPNPTTATTSTITTGNGIDLKETNSWLYSELIECMVVPNETDTIIVHVKSNKDHSTDKLKFSCGNYQSSPFSNINNNNTNNDSGLTTMTQQQQQQQRRSDEMVIQPTYPVIISVRSILLSFLLRQQDISGQMGNTNRRYPIFTNVQRYTRSTTTMSNNCTRLVTLQILPYGIVEYYNSTKIQTYLYIDMVAISFPAAPMNNNNNNNNNQNKTTTTEQQKQGIFIHFRQPYKILFYTIPDNTNLQQYGRTQLCTAIQEHCANLGIYHIFNIGSDNPHHVPHPSSSSSGSNHHGNNTNQQQQQYGLPMAPSFTVATWIHQRRTIPIGPIVLIWNVTKISKRHDSNIIAIGNNGSNNNNSTHMSPGGIVRRQLAITGYGYIIEKDIHTNQIINVRRLCDIYCIIRDPMNHSIITIEYNNSTTIVSYTVSINRDAMIVSIIDAAMQLGHNPIIHISDVPLSAGYCLALPLHPSCYSSNNMSSSLLFDDTSVPTASAATKAVVATLFLSTPVPQYTLKRVYTIATYVFALISGEFALPQQSETHKKEHIQYIQNLATKTECLSLADACQEFNCSVQQPAIDFRSTNITNAIEKHIVGTMGALFGIITTLLHYNGGTNPTIKTSSSNVTTTIPDPHRRLKNERIAATMFQTLYRLAKTTTGYKSSADLTTLRECLPYIWTIEDTYCKFSAFSVLNALLSGTNKDRPNIKRDMEAEYVNKNVLLKCGGHEMVDALVSSLLPTLDDIPKEPGQQLQQHHMPSDLILMITSDILQSLLCSYHDTTSPEHFQTFIAAIANRYRALLSLLRSPTPFVLENTALLLHLLSTHAPSSTTAIRDSALSSAILLQHFYSAIYSPLEGQRFLSRYLCSLWFVGPSSCDEKRLLKRMVPHGFFAYLNMPALSRIEEDQLDELERGVIEGNVTDQGAMAVATLALALSSTADDEVTSLVQQTRDAAMAAASGTNTARLRSRITLASNTSVHHGKPIPKENFRIFFHVLTQDHSMADLIWNQQTRRELRIALESELEYIRRESEARGIDGIAWNHQQFQVSYPSLDNEVKVGDVYMRLWLQAGDGFIRSWDEPVRLFEHLFRRFLCEVDRDSNVTIMCIRCLERLYDIHASSIGPFTDVLILVRSMASTRSVETQHRLLGLLATLLGVSGENKDGRYGAANIPENAEQLLNLDSISQLCQFVAWGHTNDIQVGNMLSRAIGIGISTNSMITDGTDRKPGNASKKDSSSPTATQDLMCPAIWFVTSAGRVPPPQETIRGPFRLSDLRNMMENGELSPYTFVTSSRVDEYDIDDEVLVGGVRETQIDTGKWKRLNQIWQLRWQLCTDGNSSKIYSPSDIALLSLKALTRLVDLHRSLDMRGVPYFPIPTAKRILCSTKLDPNFMGNSNDTVASPFPIICQSLLCNDKQIVDQASILIYKLCQHNDRAVSKLYLTGFYFFALCYTGNDFRMLSKLIDATHLKQHFKSGYAATADETELPMKQRSILGNLIPEGLLILLTNYGFERFADVFVSNADTPEAIWTYEMRKHLIEMIRQHLGDFPFRLYQNNTTEYEYCPMPGVAYKRLENELFCHNYYLRNLCDEVRFPDWPIAEPVEVFRACLEHFKKQINRDESSEEESLEKARVVLDLKVGDGSKELRKSYRVLARKYHPDKNPSGRDMFEAIQNSYEILLPLLERGEEIRMFAGEAQITLDQATTETGLFPNGSTQLQTMSLLIETQAMICRRYENEMSRLKYPAYQILLRCIIQPGDIEISSTQVLHNAEFAKEERAKFVLLAVELIFRTCLISPLNAEELISENGVAILSSLLNFYIEVSKQIDRSDSKFKSQQANLELVSHDTSRGIVAFTVRTLSGVAFYENGRRAMKSLPDISQFLVNWRRCIDESIFSNNGVDCSIRRYALEGISSMGREQVLQEGLIGCGVVWPTIRFIMLYDSTLEESSIDNSDFDDVGLSVSSINTIARLSIRVLGVLSGLYGDGPKQTGLTSLLNTLLTEPIARMLRNGRADAILKILNTNTERADIIWNVEMRKQLESYILKREAERPESTCQTLAEEFDNRIPFAYELLKHELKIGGIYIRHFNKVGKEALSHVERPSYLFSSILNYIATAMNNNPPFMTWVKLETDAESNTTGSLSDTNFILSMNTLRILCFVEGLLDESLSRSPSNVPSILLSLLELPHDSEGYDIGCDVLLSICSRHTFADAVIKEKTLWRLLDMLERPDPHEKCDTELEAPIASTSTLSNSDSIAKRTLRGWAVLEGLSSSPSVVNSILSTSGWLELLGVLVGYSKFTKSWSARIGAAKTLSRQLWDPNMGSLAESLLRRVLPTTLIVRLKEDPEDMLKNFDRNVDTPELIWDVTMRNELRQELGSYLDIILKRRLENEVNDASNDHDIFVRYAKLDDEIYIGGVYVARFVKEPTYNLRDPTSFLELLMQRWAKEIEVYILPLLDSSLASTSDTTTISTAGQDVLEIVTTAAIFICKVRETLCDKLAAWGYMSQSVSFLEGLLSRKIVGTPLLAVVRMLHVASSRLPNVEALSTIGHSDGRQGVVEFMIQAIGKDAQLHPDSAFMVEFLTKSYKTALGDLSKVYSQDFMRYTVQPSYNIMDPSSASGDGPVRKKVSAGDDPLGMFQAENNVVIPQSVVAQVVPPITHPNERQTGQTSTHGSAAYSYQPQASATQNLSYQQRSHSSQQDYPQNTQQSRANTVTHDPNQNNIYGPDLSRYQQNRSYSIQQSQGFNTQYKNVHSMMQNQHPPVPVGQYPSTQPHLQQSNQFTSTSNFNHVHQLNNARLPPTQLVTPPAVQNIQPYTETNQNYQSFTHQQTTQQYYTPQNHQHSVQSQLPTNILQQTSQPHPLQSQSGEVTQQFYTQSQQQHYPHGQPPIAVRQSQAPQLQQYITPQLAQPQIFPTPVFENGHTIQSASSSYNIGFNTHGAVTQSHTTLSINAPDVSNLHNQYHGQQPSENLQRQGNYSNPVSTSHEGGATSMAAQAASEWQQQTAIGTQSVDGSSLIDQPYSYKPTPAIEGKGMIDARSEIDPNIVAEQNKVNISGAPNSARGRISWLQQAIATDLCSYLINELLENPSLKQIRDPASAKVHSISLIKMLLQDPGYGSQFQLIVKEIPAWKKYNSQDHSLLITGHEQRADYFLTDGSAGSSSTTIQRLTAE